MDISLKHGLSSELVQFVSSAIQSTMAQFKISQTYLVGCCAPHPKENISPSLLGSY